MANKRISDRGLLLYYTSLEEIKKIDPCLLGKLIVQELEWMSGQAEEPTFEDVRCDIFHMHLKEQIVVRDLANNKPPKDKEQEPQVSTYTDTPLPPPPSRPKPPTSIEGPDYENRNMEEIAEYLYGIYLTETDDAVYREMNGNPYLKQHFDEVNAAYIAIKNKHREAYV